MIYFVVSNIRYFHFEEKVFAYHKGVRPATIISIYSKRVMCRYLRVSNEVMQPAIRNRETGS